MPLIPLDRGLVSEASAGAGDVRVSIQDMTYSLKSLMWRELGIVRRGPSIQDAVARIDFWTRAVLKLAHPEPKAWELVNMLTLARLMAHAALNREESRGTHYRSDFPEEDATWRSHSVLTPVIENGHVLSVEITREAVSETVAVR